MPKCFKGHQTAQIAERAGQGFRRKGSRPRVPESLETLFIRGYIILSLICVSPQDKGDKTGETESKVRRGVGKLFEYEALESSFGNCLRWSLIIRNALEEIGALAHHVYGQVAQEAVLQHLNQSTNRLITKPETFLVVAEAMTS